METDWLSVAKNILNNHKLFSKMELYNHEKMLKSCIEMQALGNF